VNRHPEFRLTLSAAAWRARIDRCDKPYEREDDEPSLDHVYQDFHFRFLSHGSIHTTPGAMPYCFTSSTRRFLARPSSLSFDATGE
jgi:hypothetical protein